MLPGGQPQTMRTGHLGRIQHSDYLTSKKIVDRQPDLTCFRKRVLGRGECLKAKRGCQSGNQMFDNYPHNLQDDGTLYKKKCIQLLFVGQRISMGYQRLHSTFNTRLRSFNKWRFEVGFWNFQHNVLSVCECAGLGAHSGYCLCNRRRIGCT